MKKVKKMFDICLKIIKMCLRCHERQRKNKTQAVLKSSLKTSTDNLCGSSEEGLKNKEV